MVEGACSPACRITVSHNVFGGSMNAVSMYAPDVHDIGPVQVGLNMNADLVLYACNTICCMSAV
jgi:hypothetical protein